MKNWSQHFGIFAIGTLIAGALLAGCSKSQDPAAVGSGTGTTTGNSGSAAAGAGITDSAGNPIKSTPR